MNVDKKNLQYILNAFFRIEVQTYRRNTICAAVEFSKFNKPHLGACAYFGEVSSEKKNNLIQQSMISKIKN